MHRQNLERPLNKQVLTAIVLATLMTVSSSAAAFKIDPRQAKPEDLKKVHHEWYNLLGAPVHEQMAFTAYACAERADAAGECTLQAEEIYDGRDGHLKPLLLGVRWNDDPNNLFAGGKPQTWMFWMTKASVLGADSRDPLLYRSHYGDLQFLHGMSHNGDKAGGTRDKMLEWMHFAYDVAIGVIQPSETLQGLRGKYPFVRHFAESKTRYAWTVRHLFANVKDIKQSVDLDSVGPAQVPLVALGALLHTIQDSYSHSHVQRNPSHRVTAYLDFKQQSSRCHGKADVRPTQLDSNFGLEFPPVAESVWLVRQVLARSPWNGAVESRLRDQVFLTENGEQTGNGGNCRKT